MGNRGFFGPSYIDPTDVWFYDNFMRPEGADYGPTPIGGWVPWPWGRLLTPAWGIRGNAITSLVSTNELRLFYNTPGSSYALEVQLNGYVSNGGITFRAIYPQSELLLIVQSPALIYTYTGTGYTLRYTLPVGCSKDAKVRIETTPTNFKVYFDGVLALNQNDTTYYPELHFVALRCSDNIAGDRFKSIGMYKL